MPVDVIRMLEEVNAEARPVWKPMHLQPVFADASYFTAEDGADVSAGLFTRSVCLPSDPKMTDADIERACNVIRWKCL